MDTATAQDARARAETQRAAALLRAARCAEDHAMAAVNAARTASVTRRPIPFDVLEQAAGERDLQSRLTAWIARKATT